jgi:hypothetical protein
MKKIRTDVQFPSFLSKKTRTAAGLFPTQSSVFYSGDFLQFGIQIAGLVTILGWTAVNMGPFFLLLKVAKILRVPENVELEGLDMHKVLRAAFPEILQTPTLTLDVDVCLFSRVHSMERSLTTFPKETHRNGLSWSPGPRKGKREKKSK